MSMLSSSRFIFSALLLLIVVNVAKAADPRFDPAFSGASSSIHSQTGKLTFIGMPSNRAVKKAANINASDPKEISLSFLNRYASAFGVTNAVQELKLKRLKTPRGGRSSMRYQQMYQGIPVVAGEMIVNLDQNGSLSSMSGEISPQLNIAPLPYISIDRAIEIAKQASAKWHNVPVTDLKTNKGVLSVYDARLLKDTLEKPALVWHLEVTTHKISRVRELVLVDAHTGDIKLHFSQLHQAKNRRTHDANNNANLPGNLVWQEGNPFPGLLDQDEQNATTFAGATYDFFLNEHNRDGIDDAGGPLISSVHWNDGISCPNAFWSGSQMVYCNGLADADDVVGHEFAHGITENESNLFYYFQSGAINESLSDVWGEFIDLYQSTGNDVGDTRWLIGEDALTIGGAIRNMMNPPAFNDPDRMMSPIYHTASSDSGGVHINSGINNKAAYLMTDGGTFNGYTVNALGYAKVADLYYEAQTNLLTSGSDYRDLYNALNQACQNLGYSAGNCNQVRKATLAVEMPADPAGNPFFSPDAALCPVGSELETIYFADEINNINNWQTSTITGAPNDWMVINDYATSGSSSLYAPDIGSTSSSVIFLTSPVNLPTNAYLHFTQAFSFEEPDWDGGVIEYNNGGSWNDLSPMFDAGQDYNGTISTEDINPLAGREGFIGLSHGYVSSRFDLREFTGQNFNLRFRIGTDSTVAGPLGWLIDDVSIHFCELIENPSCTADNLLIQNQQFDDVTNCFGELTLEAETNVTIESGAAVAFLSPMVTLGPGFSVEKGAAFRAGQ